MKNAPEKLRGRLAIAQVVGRTPKALVRRARFFPDARPVTESVRLCRALLHAETQALVNSGFIQQNNPAGCVEIIPALTCTQVPESPLQHPETGPAQTTVVCFQAKQNPHFLPLLYPACVHPNPQPLATCYLPTWPAQGGAGSRPRQELV